MSNPFEPPEEDSTSPEEAAYPWQELESEPEDPDAPRERHDAFTAKRKSDFLTALAETGCILDACRKIGVVARTVYRHQESDPRFHDHCLAALRMSATPIELTAWQRAVEGVEQEFAVGGEVRVRRRYDGGLLRLLLQGSNRKKYGPRPGFKRKRLMKFERRQMERDVRAELSAQILPQKASVEETCIALAKRLKEFSAAQRVGEDEAKLAEGWTRSSDGHWIPPGYAPVPGWSPPPPDDAGDGERFSRPDTPRDSM